MGESQEKVAIRTITFPTDGLVPAVAGIMCAMAKDSKFTSSQLSKFLQHIHGSLLSAEFAQIVDIEAEAQSGPDAEDRAELVTKSFKIHGQSLQNLVNYWKSQKCKYIEHVAGAGRQSEYTVTLDGLQYFMEEVLLCESGLNELRVDYLLLSIYTIRTTPLSIIHEAYPQLESHWPDSAGVELKWDWGSTRGRFVGLLMERRKAIEELSETNDQLPEIISKAKKAATGVGAAGVVGALIATPMALSLPLVGYFAYRSQRDKGWGKSLKVLANMYESFRPSYAKHDMEEGIQFRSSMLYAPMVAILGQTIRTLERLQ